MLMLYTASGTQIKPDFYSEEQHITFKIVSNGTPMEFCCDSIQLLTIYISSNCAAIW